MPISGPSSYVSTLESFLAHWALVNRVLGVGNEMTLAVGPANAVVTVPRSVLVALRADLDGAQGLVQSALNKVELSRGDVTLGKDTLLPLAQAYGRKVRGLFPPGSPYLGMTPEMPVASAGQETFLRPMRDVSDAWHTIDSGGPSFTLPPDATSFDDFTDAVEKLDTDWQTLNTREVEYGYELDKRNALQVRAVEILGRYRPTVESLFALENPLVPSIPRLRPLPGHTPDAVEMAAVWDAVEGKARLTWSASADTALSYYQIRMCPSETYDAEAESLVVNIPKVGALEYLASEGLLFPGAVASFKTYVILDTDNERGSNAVSVTRP